MNQDIQGFLVALGFLFMLFLFLNSISEENKVERTQWQDFATLNNCVVDATIYKAGKDAWVCQDGTIHWRLKQ